MKTDHEIRQNVMRRVRMMYVVRQATSPALRGGVLLGALFVLTQIVSLRDVVSNALATNGFANLSNFVYSAVTTTESSVLILTSLTILLVGWFIFDQVQSLVEPQAV